jgi:uroporphyrinogen decarboxylase
MDPCLLYAQPEVIQSETEAMLKAFGPYRHIANLGHGVYPDTPVEHVKTFISTVKTFRH